MPYQNNSSTLQRVLTCLLGLNYPKKSLRLFFVDGGSTDNSSSIITKFFEDHATEYSEIRMVHGDEFVSLPKSRNYCLRESKDEECVWFVDSDVAVTPDSLTILLEMSKKFDICALYYTHDREEDPPQATGIRAVRAVRTGCTLITPKTIRTIGFFNEKMIHEIEDTDYCLRANQAGLKVGFDEVHEQLHLKEGRKYPWYHPISRTIIRRRSRAWWFANETFTRRWVAYFVMFGLLLLLPISPLFALPTLAFFLFQLARGIKPLDALARTIVALLLPPTSIFAFLEIHLWRRKSMNPKEIDPAFK
jgi:GT2 family glycosyltransferase